jgi:hypothetical protein
MPPRDAPRAPASCNLRVVDRRAVPVGMASCRGRAPGPNIFWSTGRVEVAVASSPGQPNLLRSMFPRRNERPVEIYT